MSQFHPDERHFEAEWEEGNDAELEQPIVIPEVHKHDKDERIEARITTGLVLGILGVGATIAWKKHKRGREE